MSSQNEMSWSLVIIGLMFCLLAAVGAGNSVLHVLHSLPGWVLPVYGVVVGIFTAVAAVILITVLTALHK